MDLKTFEFNPVNEKLSTFRYKIPKNKSQLMFDFYVLSALPIWGLKTSTRYARDADELTFVTKDTLKKLVKYIQQELLDVVLYALTSEFRHIIAFANINDIKNNKHRKFLEKYISEVVKLHPNPEFSMLDTPKTIIDDELDKYFDGYVDANFFNKNGRSISAKAISKITTPEKFVDIAEDIFNLSVWGAGCFDYGGVAWAKIAQGWKKLNKAKNDSDRIVYIDHVFDLQHNNDTVLNKSKSYADDYGEYEWIKKALDKKKNAKSLFDLVNDCSPSLKYFAARVIKAATGETFQSYMKNIKTTSGVLSKTNF